MTVIPGEQGARLAVRTLPPTTGGEGPGEDLVQIEELREGRAASRLSVVVPRGALVRALLPDDVRGYLLDLIDTMDDGQERDMGYAADTRERAADLIALR